MKRGHTAGRTDLKLQTGSRQHIAERIVMHDQEVRIVVQKQHE